MAQPRVLIVDDHRLVADAMSRLLVDRFNVIGTITDASLAVDGVVRLKPDVVLLDLSMPGVTGFDVLRERAARRLETRLIILTMLDDPVVAVDALTAGASGFLLKDAGSEELLTAIDVVLTGGTYLSTALAKDTIELMIDARARSRIELTSEQREVLKLVALGQRVKEIAEVLNMSPRRVETVKYRLMEVFDVQTTAQLIRYTAQNPFMLL